MIDWIEVMLAYLHDPPDKALSVRGHVSRARDNARVVFGNRISRRMLEEAVTVADPLASIIERLPMPKAGEGGERTVGPRDRRLAIFHPLSGAQVFLEVPELTEELTLREREALGQILTGISGVAQDQVFNTFLAIWRLWSDFLVEHVHPCFARLPADTRTPDHTIWNHVDVTAAYKAALGEGGAALLAFALGPVQRFIEASRSVRDLWSSSMILSWLAFKAMLPVIESFGPTAIIYPTLRGNPLLDLWLRDSTRLGPQVLPQPDVHLRLTPALPHRFLALIPWGRDGGTAHDLAGRCRRYAEDAVKKELAKAVREALRRPLDDISPNWDRRWDRQIENYFEFAAAVVPLGGTAKDVDDGLANLLAGAGSFAQAFRDAEAVREMARAIPDDDQPFRDATTGTVLHQDHAGRWQYQVELAQRSLAAHRAIRRVPPNPPLQNPSERYPQKCTLLGSFEQMGPDDLAESRKFWETVSSEVNLDGVRVRSGEALCAVALMKRFAGPAFLAKQLEIEAADLWFPDTWTVAAAEWLKRAGIDPDQVRRTYGDWNGSWLHWPAPDFDLEEAGPCPDEVFAQISDARQPQRLGSPPVYYAILKLDGDDLGGWLRGENSPRVREVVHQDLVQYYESLGQSAVAGLDARRPVGPALHAAISTALTNFALHVVPEVVASHHGTVIYSGGDDTLVLLPVSTALLCALELRKRYARNWYRKGSREYMLMGSRATLSGSLVVVHAKDDLRLALQDARRAEKRAKDSGRDALAIVVRRRSGEYTTAICPWYFVTTVEEWRQAFVRGASDRWAYRLYAIGSALGHLPVDAIRAEMRRQLRRAEEPTSSLIPPDQLVQAFDSLLGSTVTDKDGTRPRFASPGTALQELLTLCHTASFLARGRDA